MSEPKPASITGREPFATGHWCENCEFFETDIEFNENAEEGQCVACGCSAFYHHDVVVISADDLAARDEAVRQRVLAEARAMSFDALHASTLIRMRVVRVADLARPAEATPRDDAEPGS